MTEPPINLNYIEEILEQPEALARCAACYPKDRADIYKIANAFQRSLFDQIVITGMGSSEYGAYPLWLKLNNQTRVPAILGDASELIHHSPNLLTDKSLLVAVSQSGESIETVQVHKRMAKPLLSISLTNGLENSLAGLSDMQLDICAGTEATVSTKTYVNTLALLSMLGCQLMGGNITELQEIILAASKKIAAYLQNWEEKVALIRKVLGKSDRLAFVGRGPSLASVRCGSLITMESTKVFCLGLSGGQFRHGPIEIARSGFTAVIFAGLENTRLLNRKLAQEISANGGQVLYISPDGPDGEIADNFYRLSIPSGDADTLPIFEIIPIQLLTIALAQDHGIEVAKFTQASKITMVE